MTATTTPHLRDDRVVDAATVEGAALAALALVYDPEYPDVSILDLGLFESLTVDHGLASVGLIPTFSGCPALHMIADDVRCAIEAVDGVERCDVTWLPGPVWTTARMTADATRRLADEYTVVLRGRDGNLRCPVCGSHDVDDQAMVGPTRCRSVAWCASCRNAVEVMRS